VSSDLVASVVVAVENQMEDTGPFQHQHFHQQVFDSAVDG